MLYMVLLDAILRLLPLLYCLYWSQFLKPLP